MEDRRHEHPVARGTRRGDMPAAAREAGPAPLGWSFFEEGTEQRGAVLADVIDLPMAEVGELALVAEPMAELDPAIQPSQMLMPMATTMPTTSPMPILDPTPTPELPPPSTVAEARRRLALSLERQPELRASASAELADEVMRGVLNGRWAIADHFEGEERRFVIARRCSEGDGRALSEREREVLALAVQGHSNKAIAYELGLTSSTVATHLRRILAKLHIESREELIQILPYGLVPLPGGDEPSGALSRAASKGRLVPRAAPAQPPPIGTSGERFLVDAERDQEEP